MVNFWDFGGYIFNYSHVEYWASIEELINQRIVISDCRLLRRDETLYMIIEFNFYDEYDFVYEQEDLIGRAFTTTAKKVIKILDSEQLQDVFPISVRVINRDEEYDLIPMPYSSALTD